MCEFFSCVLTRDAAFWSKHSDSHESIIEEYKLHADGARGPNIVRIEIRPPSMDSAGLCSDPATWTYKLDQDWRPEWYEPVTCEARARACLAEALPFRLVTSGHREVREGRVFACGSSSVVAWGSSSVVAWGSSRVVAWDSSSVVAWGSSSVVARDSSSVVACGSSSVVARDSSSVVAWDSSSVEAWDSTTAIVRSSRCKWELHAEAVCVDRTGSKPVCHVAQD